MKRATNVIMDFPEIQNISIHALVKRATNVIMDFPEIQNISIHALVKRATGTPVVSSEC